MTATAPGSARPAEATARPDAGSGHADRWTPDRAGLVSVWRYVEETFRFHRGRLLLRGPNGSGKSMALELLLPFLLDADTNPNRLTSAARSRGGMFDRVMTGSDEPSRTGFVWVEFRRGDDHFTIGARLRASRSTRRVDVDYFTADARVGHDFHLLDERRVPLSLKALKESLADRGQVHGSAEEYRNAVRTTLYEGFGPDRYASVVTALLALRKEKLSQNLDLDKLSEVMSEALPPLDEHDIAAVAEGFERLDRRREQLEVLAADVKEVDTLASRQRSYARQIAAWLSAEVRAAETRRDEVTRLAREAAEQLAVEQRREGEVAERQQALEARVRNARAEIDGFRQSDAYREGSRLLDLRRQLTERRADVAAARAADDEAADRYRRATRALAEAADRLGSAEANLEEARRQLDVAANSADAVVVVGQAVAAVQPGGSAEDGGRLVEAHLAARRQAIREVRSNLRHHERATQQRDSHQESVADAVVALDATTDAAALARTGLDETVEAYGEEVRAWIGSCRQVATERLVDALPADLSDPRPVAVAVGRLREELRGEHERLVGGLRHEQDVLDEGLVALEAERDRLAAGSIVEPEPPAWRSDRAGQEGGALWRLVDVDPSAAGPDLDGVEAALAASGLLDAWVGPPGTVDLSRADLTLRPRPRPEPTLRSVLVPLDDAELDVGVIDRVLRSVPLVATVDGLYEAAGRDPGSAVGVGNDDPETEVAIGLDGTFRLGAAVGRGRSGRAELLGAEARDRRRLARLDELEAQVDANRAGHRRLGDRIEAAGRAWAAVAAEFDTLPDGLAVEAATASVLSAEAAEEQCRRQHEQAGERLAASEAAVREALRQLMVEASRLGVPTDDAGLDDLEQALVVLERSSTAWGRRWRERGAAARAVDREQEEVAAAAGGAERTRETLARHTAAMSEHEAHVAAIEEALGSRYEEVVDRIADLERRAQLDADEQRTLADELRALLPRIGRLEERVRQTEDDRAEAEASRAVAHDRFVVAAGRGLMVDAGHQTPDVDGGVTAVLGAARELAAALGSIEIEPTRRERAGARVEEQLHVTRQRLVGYDIDRTPTDDGWTDLTAVVGGQRRRVTELAAALRANLDSAMSELDAEEEQLFARVLAGDIRRALAARIRHANDLVGRINGQLDQVRTRAAGVQARLSWTVDDEQPDAIRSARALLLRDPGDLTESETAALQAFVRARVEQARLDVDANAPWEVRLRETLDYRRWHRFTLQIAHRDWGGYQDATHRRLQKLSTGERSIALHLPMLASIAAHYTAADGGPAACPRLIMLDELFAGVDPANRSQLFACFTDWDLDAVFTSDHEWCQYSALDGIAIHHLHPPVGDEPVTSTRFAWDGRQRTIDPVEEVVL